MIGHKALENSSGTPFLHGAILDTIVSTTVCNSTMVIFFMRLSFISMLKVTWRPTKTIGDLLTNIQLFVKVKANPLRSFILVKALPCLSLSSNDRPYIFLINGSSNCPSTPITNILPFDFRYNCEISSFSSFSSLGFPTKLINLTLFANIVDILM